ASRFRRFVARQFPDPSEQPRLIDTEIPRERLFAWGEAAACQNEALIVQEDPSLLVCQRLQDFNGGSRTLSSAVEQIALEQGLFVGVVCEGSLESLGSLFLRYDEFLRKLEQRLCPPCKSFA